LINKIDMLLTSVGPPDRPLGWLGDDLLRAVGLKRAQVAQLVEGDISGVLLPRQGRDIKLDGHLEKIRGAWTGITMDDLKRCHERAQRNGMPGVVVIALGKNKATAVAEVIRLGICDHLFIDRELSENLKKALRA
jgi:DNA-binding transcriptional regulator LsrR (DeoR family)